MRQLTRTLIARVFAAIVVVLAVSPVTAPFSTFDWLDAPTHDPSFAVMDGGQHGVVHDVKVDKERNTTRFTPLVAVALPQRDHRDGRAFAIVATTGRSALRAILRI